MGNSRGLVLLVLVMSTAPALWAQEQASKLELYGGYDYIRFNIKSKVSGQPPSQTFQGNGGGGEFVYNVKNWLGVLGDVSGGLGDEYQHAVGRRRHPVPFRPAGQLPPRHRDTVRPSSPERRCDQFRD
jgi:hypothetical protein